MRPLLTIVVIYLTSVVSSQVSSQPPSSPVLTSSSDPNIFPECECKYFRASGLFSWARGCRITAPPPAGFKCSCQRGWGWQRSCRGLVTKCSNAESCPPNCVSRSCCINGGGNCRGYFEETSKMDTYRDCLVRENILSDRLIERHTNKSYYDVLNHQWNQRLPKVYPLAYFLPLTTPHVQSAVRCGVEAGIHLTASSGGHSYAGLSFGTGDSVIVDFRQMTRISVHASNMTSTIEAGSTIGHIYSTLWENGGFLIPMGNCLTVGIGGHALGGGDGYYASLYGTVVDNIVEMTVVDVKGRALIANAQTNSDLYWAFRGIGQAYFGLVTQFKIKMYDAKPIKASFINLHYPKDHFPKVMEAFQKISQWVDDNEPSVAVGFHVIPDLTPGKPVIFPVPPGMHVQFLQIQDPVYNPVGNSSFLAAMDEIMPKEGRTTMGSYGVPHWQFVLANAYVPIRYKGEMFISMMQPGAPTVKDLRKEMALLRFLRAKSFYVKKRFTLSQLEEVGRVINRMPKDLVRIMTMTERGAMAVAKPTDMAYVHRETLFSIVITFETLDPADLPVGNKWLDEFFAAIQFMDGGETYQGFPDLELKDYSVRHFAQNLPKLITIKNKYDPANYFNQRQSVPIR